MIVGSIGRSFNPSSTLAQLALLCNALHHTSLESITTSSMKASRSDEILESFHCDASGLMPCVMLGSFGGDFSHQSVLHPNRLNRAPDRASTVQSKKPSLVAIFRVCTVRTTNTDCSDSSVGEMGATLRTATYRPFVGTSGHR